MGDESEWKKLPTEEKCEHKNWKARLEGYEEACKLFRLASLDSKSSAYMTYLGLVKKFVTDTNQVAQDKGLEAVLAFVENVSIANKTVGEVMPGIVAKCMNARPKIREKAIEVILMYIEAEKQEIVQEELIKGLENKQPKIVQACLEVLRMAIGQFGSKIMPIKPVIKFIPKLLADRDKTVRDEAKLIAVEMFRWAGNAIMPQLQSVTPIIMAELEEEFKNIKEGNVEKARQTRFLRSQQDLKAKMEAEAEQQVVSNGDNPTQQDGQTEEEEVVDPYDLLEPFDILSKLPKDFKDKLEAKKWQERKEVLDNLHSLTQKNPRLQTAYTDYYELVNDLQKLVAKDSNVNIVVTSAKCITDIANGLRKDFSRYAVMYLQPLLERTKEKKQHIVDALREACTAIYPSTTLEAIVELIIACLGHKTPIVRINTAQFISRCFCMATTTNLPKKVLKQYLPPLIKNLSEADGTVRESSCEALGALLKALGEKILLPNLTDLEALKLDKIKEYAEKTILLIARGEPRAGMASKPVADPVKQTQPVVIKAGPPAKTATKSSTLTKKTASKTTATKDDKKKVVKDDKKLVLPDEPDLHSETAEEKAQELFGAECYTGLSNSNWKERLTSVESMNNKIKSMPSDEVPCQVIVRMLAKKPGFKDTHFQVLKQRIELVASIAGPDFKFTQRSASYCVNEMAEKIGDLKVGSQVKHTLACISEQCTLAYVCTLVLPSIFEAKNPKNHENLLIWLSTSIREFGFKGIELKFILKYIKEALQNINPAVRTASYQLIGTVYLYAGPSFGALFEQEKPAILELINAEIEKVRNEKAPVPTRGHNIPKAKNNDAADGDNDDSGGGDDGDDDDPMEIQRKQEALMPRTDISELLNDALMDQLNDKAWKERQAALEKIDQILRDNKFIEANLSEFPTHLVKRLTDTNKILATSALKISEKLSVALGSQGKRYVSTLAPGMIQALSDAKPALRNTALSALSCWYDNCGGLSPFLEGDLLMEALAKATNPNIKAELCNWLIQVLPKSKKGKLPPELKAIVPSIFAYVEDRNPEVRIKSQELILPLMLHIGPNDMLRAMQKAKPSSVTILQPLIEKARAEVAARQPAPAPKTAAAAPPSTKTVAASKKPAKTIYDDSPDESYDPPEPTPAPSAPAKKNVLKKDGKGGKTTESDKPTLGTTSSKKKGAEDDDMGPIMQLSNKQKRMDEERALKTLKWNFDVPRKEFVDQLRNQIENANFNKTLITQLFHEDFKKQILALDTLSRAITECPEATISNLDILLRWLSLRFFETNPTVMLKAIEFQLALFNMLLEKKVNLTDFEANGFIPYFIGKLGDRQESIRKGFRQIIKLITQCHAPVKVFNFLVQGLASKNSRQRTECLEELGQMIEAMGLNSFNPNVNIKEIAKQISDRDNGVRSAALNTITIAYQIVGDQVYKLIGRLNDKEMSYLEERIKRSAKQPLPQQQQQQQSVKASASGQLNGMATSNSLSSINSAKVASSSSSSSVALDAQAFIDESNSKNKMTPKKYQTITKQSKQQQQKQGEFCLDIKDDDDDRNSDIQIKLTTHQDLDELLNEPVEMPPPRKNVHNYPMSILKESQDCHEAIDLVITHISHQKLDISFQNLVQIDVVIKDKEKRDLLVPHIDNLLNTCALKLNVAHNVYLSGSDYQVEEVFRLFKGLFSVILDIFENDLGKHANSKTLKDVIYNLLCVMIDSKILSFSEGDQLIKAINIVTLRLLELSNQTTSYCALVKLLNESCNNESSVSCTKYLELVMKCIWRQIRRLSSNSTALNDALIQQIDTSKVLQEIHTFLSLYPSNSWQSKQSDLPLRTVKTLLFHLAKAKQSKIIEDLDSINVPDDSEIKIYIVKLFKNGFQLTNNNNASSSNNNNNYNGNSKAADNSLDMDKVGQLRSIVRRISSEQSKESLRELYDFKQKNADVDLNKYFEKSSGKLKTYIQENLKLIESELNGNGNGNTNSNHFIKTSITSSSSNGSGMIKNTFLTNDLNKNSHVSSSGRNVDDIMKTIADWKSKTHLNILDNDDNDENNIRSSTTSSNNNNYGLNNDYNSRFTNSNGSVHRQTTLNTLNNSNNTSIGESPASIKAEKYQNIVKDLKKKYTRSRTEPLRNRFSIPVDDQSDQLSDLKALDAISKSKNLTESSSSSSNLNSLNLQQSPVKEAPASSEYSQISSEMLYDEYKRRFELIKKLKN